MKVTGIELLQMIKDEEIKENTIFELDNDCCKAIYKKDEDNILSLMWENSKKYVQINTFFINNFTIIEELKEDEFKEVELLDTPYTKNENDFLVQMKINELIEQQNKIIKKINEK